MIILTSTPFCSTIASSVEVLFHADGSENRKPVWGIFGIRQLFHNFKTKSLKSWQSGGTVFFSCFF